ncbi:MAG: hypothetical protein K8J08_15135, partial [Thermoanaerobaculia bacterium]|nr:hypothetical protein [Thermoanaerobaculia bacterium]
MTQPLNHRLALVLSGFLLVTVSSMAAQTATEQTSTEPSSASQTSASQSDIPGDDTPFFNEVMEVDVVNVDVFVTDKGNPVLDLTESDFEVFEDGKPVVITNFRIVRPKTQSERLAERNVIPTTDVEAPRPGMAPAALDPASALHLILYVDNDFIRSNNRLRVLHDL